MAQADLAHLLSEAGSTLCAGGGRFRRDIAARGSRASGRQTSSHPTVSINSISVRSITGCSSESGGSRSPR
jgi:hypothetical protein